MRDRRVSVLHVAAGALWAIGALLALAYVALGLRGTGVLGLLVAMAGGVTNIKAMLVHLEERERRAFQLGRDYERARLQAVD